MIKNVLVFAFVLLMTNLKSQINLMGYHQTKVEEKMEQMHCTLDSKEKFGEKDAMFIYSDEKMPVKYVYLFDGKYKMCYGVTISVLSKDRPYMDSFIKWANEKLEKDGDKWIETTEKESFEYIYHENTDVLILSIKSKKIK